MRVRTADKWTQSGRSRSEPFSQYDWLGCTHEAPECEVDGTFTISITTRLKNRGMRMLIFQPDNTSIDIISWNRPIPRTSVIIISIQKVRLMLA